MSKDFSKVSRQLKCRKFTMLELVDLDTSTDAKLNDDDYDVEVELHTTPRRERRYSKHTYCITDLRTFERLPDRTSQQVRIFKHACKKSELSRFCIVRTDKRKPKYTLTYSRTGKVFTDVCEEELQAFIGLNGASSLADCEVFENDNEFLESVDKKQKVSRKDGNCKDHRKGSYAEPIETDSKTSSNGVTVLPYSPELDTVRVFFDCRNLIDLDILIPFTATKKVYLATRALGGHISKEFTQYRTEMKCSWYGKMQITREEKYWGKNASHSFPVLCFEYSVAKWYNFTNGINSGNEPTAQLLLYPCLQAMYALHIERFAFDDKVTFDFIAKEFMEKAELRRFDLSLNFRTPSMYKSADYVQVCSRCHINRQTSNRHSDGSFSWGGEKSPYRVIVYDKETEQKDYYNRKEPGGVEIWFEDAEGNTYETQNADCTLIEKVLDHNQQKKDFYNANKEKFENVFRYEVQFRPKFIQEIDIMPQGKENIDKILRMGEVYWRDIINGMDEQLGRENFNTTEGKDGFAHVLDRLTSMKLSETISNTVYNNMLVFLMRCTYGTWQSVRDELGKSLFSQKYNWVKDNLDYDLKVAPVNDMPIMRIM